MKFLKVSNIKLSIDEKEQKAFEKAIKIAGIHSDDVIAVSYTHLTLPTTSRV